MKSNCRRKGRKATTKKGNPKHPILRSSVTDPPANPELSVYRLRVLEWEAPELSVYRLRRTAGRKLLPNCRYTVYGAVKVLLGHPQAGP